MITHEKDAGIFMGCRDWNFHKRAMSDFGAGACWPHVAPMMLRAAVASLNDAMMKLGLPYHLECDHGAQSIKLPRRIFLICGDGDVKTVKVELTDTMAIINKKPISLKGHEAAVSLVEGVIDALEYVSLAPPPKRRVGRPPKLRLPISGCMVKRTWQPEPRRTTPKRTPVARKTMLPKRPPLKKGDHRA